MLLIESGRCLGRRAAFPRALLAAFAAFTACLGLAACGQRTEAPAAATAMPAPPVRVAEASSAPLPQVIELPGRVEAVRGVEVRARVDGIVLKQLFREGSDVAAGTPLFQIDPADTRASLQQAEAALLRAQALRDNEAGIVERFRSLVARQAVSAQEFDSAQTALRQGEANVLDAQAALTQARLRLERSTVRAPIAGRVGRAQVPEGALVSAASATLLTQVDQLSPIFATFAKSNAQLMALEQQIESGAVRLADPSHIEVRLILPNGQEYAEKGYLDFTDLAVDPATGSQALRARFPNLDRRLLPGQFVRGRVLVGETGSGVTIPARAVQFNGDAASVFIVDADGTAQRREVRLGAQGDKGWLVLDGIHAGERVVTDGWQTLRPGQKVDARTEPTAGAGTGTTTTN